MPMPTATLTTSPSKSKGCSQSSASLWARSRALSSSPPIWRMGKPSPPKGGGVGGGAGGGVGDVVEGLEAMEIEAQHGEAAELGNGVEGAADALVEERAVG